MAKRSELPDMPSQLLQFYLPGLEIAANNLIDQMNQIRRVLGLPADYRLALGNGVQTVYHEDWKNKKSFDPKELATPAKRTLSPEGRAAISAAVKKRWKKLHQEKAAPPATGKASTPRATLAQLTKWATKHENILDLAKFKAAHPNRHCRLVGAMVGMGQLKPISKGVYEYMPPAKAASA